MAKCSIKKGDNMKNTLTRVLLYTERKIARSVRYAELFLIGYLL